MAAYIPYIHIVDQVPIYVPGMQMFYVYAVFGICRCHTRLSIGDLQYIYIYI